MSNKKSNKSRRKLLKSIAAGSGAVVAGKSLPESWSKPVVDTVMLPAHATTTQEDSCNDTDVIPGGEVKCSDGSYNTFNLFTFSLDIDGCLTWVMKVYDSEAPQPLDNEFRIHFHKRFTNDDHRMTVNTAQGIGPGWAVDQFCLNPNADSVQPREHALEINGVAYTASFTLYKYQTSVSISDITVAPAT